MTYGTLPPILQGFVVYLMFLLCAIGTLGMLALTVTLWRFYLQVRLREGQELRRVMGTLGGKADKTAGQAAWQRSV